MTRNEARAALEPILEYLRAEEAQHAIVRNVEDWQEYGDREDEGAPHWDFAHEMCHALLTAANRDGHGGCRLCRS